MQKEAICHEQDGVVLMHSSAVYGFFCFHWTVHKDLLYLSESEHTSVACLFYHFTFPLFPIKSHDSGGKAKAQKSKQATQVGLYMSSAAVSGSTFFTFDHKKK